ncbi:Tudor domain-containing protein [Aphelenchoides fujianensis]|nr:Tudor domain-containing protein [Aphelenchoides fujianensis]
MHWDLSAVSSLVLPARLSTLDGPLVLQLAAWRNVSHSALKEHLGNTGVCRLSLTDGHSTIDGFSTQPLGKLDGKTPLGAKILLDGKISTEGNLLLLTPENTRLLGGHVKGLRRAEAIESLSNGLPNAPKWTSVANSEEKEREIVERGWAHFESRSILPNTPWNPSNPPRPDDPQTTEFKRRRSAAITELVVPPKRRRIVHGRFQR